MITSLMISSFLRWFGSISRHYVLFFPWVVTVKCPISKILGLSIPELGDIICRNAHLVHEHWYRMNFTSSIFLCEFVCRMRQMNGDP
jgi:hypothetical protein